MEKEPERFYGKVLLFGEYTVLLDSMGLMIPYVHYSGELSFISQQKYTDRGFARNSNEFLLRYTNYLTDKISQNHPEADLDYTALVRDVHHGLYFESTIPQGYGLGSSGALVAAIYRKYALNPVREEMAILPDQIYKLKRIFQVLESYFHGTSSGLDPLNCYLKIPLLVENLDEIKPIGIPRHDAFTRGAIFLIDTGSPCLTESLVNLFMEKYNRDKFRERIDKELIPLNNKCIHGIVYGDFDTFYKDLYLLSAFQFEHMREMIPDNFVDLWKSGIESKDYLLKLLGSGGGGFLMGFTEDYTNVKRQFSKMALETVLVYQNR
ncbi:MAG: hypothetical protein JSV24_05465 [Bacteroidales bacterium]|nr:MAG: hypothetical protein JSV24_05465 [Bacteroidales bacterium]